MKNYELMSIIKSSLTEDKAKEEAQAITAVITSLGGTLSKHDYLGRRKFAYQVKNQIDGFYDVFDMSLDESKVTELKSKLNYMDSILRYLITTS